jgi:hypothetical protein
MTTKSTEGADVVRRLAVMDQNNTSGTGSPSRPRSRTSPNIPRANVNPVTIDSPVIKAVEILEKIKKEGVKSEADIDFVIRVLTSTENNSPSIPKIIENLSNSTGNSNGGLLADQDMKSFLLYHSNSREWQREEKSVVKLTRKAIKSDPTLRPNKLKEDDVIKKILPWLNEWDFPVFEIEKITEGRPLFYTTVAIFRKARLLEQFNIDEDKFLNFLTRVEEGYRSPGNSYHNNMHACDVLQSVNFILNNCGLAEFVGDIGVLAALLAAIIHDYLHPGFTNQYLINSDNDLAITYNDQSVLENFHCAQAFKIFQDKDCNIFAGMPRQMYQEIRELMIQMVLATDITKHFKLISEFKTKSATSGLSSSKKEDIQLVLVMVMKLADLGHTAKSCALHINWCNRITQEFFHQGDEEKRLKIPQSPFMDRDSANLPKSETGFLTYLVYPLYEVFSSQFPEAAQFLEQLNINLAHWQRLLQPSPHKTK